MTPQDRSGRKPNSWRGISEDIPCGHESGLGLMLAGLMGEPDEISPLPSFILIDGGDGFDPSSLNEAACSRLLWVRTC